MDQKEDHKRTDQTVVEKVLRGDTKAFSVIIKNTEGLVAQIIFKMIPNHDDRKDIAQDVYLKVFQKLASFKFEAKLSTWIGQITYNTCVNFLEKKKLPLVDIATLEQETDEEGADRWNNLLNPFDNDIEKYLINKEFSQILAVGIDRLPPLYKTLITLYHTEELSCAEIAQIVQLPEGTVKSYLFRARRALRDQVVRIYNKGML
ncbi:RNA polymerase sigma factor [Spirosoma endbachense]|uniref:Sigma-70 family RNA polymerase sigma factor n=1 Tax=Spirosoma endbachense TaxID=2666025 RepID=A0A6P1VRQ5_9BACT|nr:sigma-70 family RNA polymerase sigma factor [Spirosoma endbachense]QHV95375.1 sigma-70 family RNA polymerase sigma factor [Spirosoma endbachense]